MTHARSSQVALALGAALLVAGCSNAGSAAPGGSAASGSTAPGTGRTTSPATATKASGGSGAASPSASSRAASAGSSRTAPSPAASPAIASPAPAPSPAPAFVTVDKANARFVLAGKPFYFAGTNAYYLMQSAAYGQTQQTLDALDAAQACGYRVIRTWGFADGGPSGDPSVLQTSPGVYQDSAWKGMDFVLAEAAKRGLHLIVTLTNNWDDYGGMNQYVKWAGLASHDQFYTDPGVKQLYKNYVHDFVTHTSSITGIAYEDDPTILSWELANEAECKSDVGALQGTLVAWYSEMSAYLKSIDPHHLVSTGEEGFDTTTSGYTSFTSYTTYFWLFALTDGTSFTANVAIPTIDWGGIHLYPDTWQWLDPTRDGVDWIQDHVAVARAQGKPLVLGEYGLEHSPRSTYKAWLDAVASSGAAGALVWELVPTSRAAAVADPFNLVDPTDATDVANQTAAAAVMNAK